ncbi:MAG TPA: DUF2897 family protein [Marinobacter sp.]|uniref:DUF2897 family protein n=1 Tax=Marinobacter sp. TaxID=50741 RepID=UPI00261DC730|nr:DUF2897 family protein [Marinobacter sp.]HET8800530.1 DUF2897 family protein [Marinobacter sp.]
MPTIGWIVIVVALGFILGGIMFLLKSANSMHISDEKMEKIRKRKAELEAREADDEDRQ